jgi:RNA polymerase-binding transcription factor
MRKDLDLDQFQKMLETERINLQQRIDLEMKSVQSYSDATPDLLDVAATTTAQSEIIGLLNHLKEKQTQIDEAIQRLKTGKFGICVHCGTDIEIERLQVKPYAKYCIKCKEHKEQKIW